MEEVVEAADLLLWQNDCPTEVIPIIRYFINTYIGSNGVDAQPPLLPITFWTMKERFQTDFGLRIVWRVGTEGSKLSCIVPNL